ncbi:Carrier domain-containing protein [Sulfidibacter corallicola]|uniref:Carrier domain-containing protein n=1 Tax=Sulfidibacter corallicola TaxID=2818388 RepID=A0A8A4TTQ4_SULCO|nr:phosphopantetheine-binding protein [Sulfidibacter corallicola]QTD52488.1 hypothetical protein J3U87_08450 [Sulfidibacter corallicola]
MLQTQETTFDIVTRLIREVIQEKWIDDVEITRDTVFSEELELDSIELVVLAEKINNRFGDHLNFAKHLSGMELEAIVALTVGDIVEFIESCR